MPSGGVLRIFVAAHRFSYENSLFPIPGQPDLGKKAMIVNCALVVGLSRISQHWDHRTPKTHMFFNPRSSIVSNFPDHRNLGLTSTSLMGPKKP